MASQVTEKAGADFRPNLGPAETEMRRFECLQMQWWEVARQEHTEARRSIGCRTLSNSQGIDELHKVVEKETV